MYIHPDTVEQIKDRMDTLDVVGDFVKDLKKQGSRYIALSPFTKEKTPSFYVTPSKNMFKCFSTGIGGDGITFLMESEKMTYPEALQYVAQKYGIELKHHTPTEEEQKEIDEKKEFFALNDVAQKQWEKALLTKAFYDEFEANKQWWVYMQSLVSTDADGQELTTLEPSEWHQDWKLPNPIPALYETVNSVNPCIQELLYKRRLDLDTIHQFKLGYAPDKWKFLQNGFKESGTVKLAESIGLLKKGQSGFHDAFRHRLMFPIYDHQGKLVGFGGRALNEVRTAKKNVCYEFINGKIHKNKAGEFAFTPKAINSKDSKIYSKKNVLYGLNLAIKGIRSSENAIIVEGYNDVIALHQSEMDNAVGTCGTALTREHLLLLKRYTSNLTLIYDGDPAGTTSAFKAAEMAIKAGFGVRICMLPDKHDPDSFARLTDGAVSTKKHFEEFTDMALIQMAKFSHADKSNDPIKKENFLQSTANLMSYILGDTIRDGLIKEISKLYDVTLPTFRKMVDQNLEIRGKETEKERIIARKNKVVKLEGEAHIYPFFREEFTAGGDYKGIKIDKVRFITLLKYFGYSRFYIEGSDTSTFVRVAENLIDHVKQDEIIDHLEDFIYRDYDFEKAGFSEVDADILWNKFLDSLKTLFNKDLFARVRNSDKIIVSKDTKDTTYFYYKNGFVEINSEGWQLRPYADMDGGIWANQVVDRKFEYKDPTGARIDKLEFGVFSNFVWKIAGEDESRFFDLCAIIGYSVHDYYEYKLKAINITDSSMSRESDGRSGKTLLLKMMKYVRNVAEINGKEFRHDDKGKYADVDINTQLTGINDIITKGRYKFEFESIFNDVTEGAMVKRLYMDAFRKYFKLWILSNAPLEIHGGSQRDRIVEFELSQHFTPEHSPEEEYGLWLGRDFDQKEWMYYDNFMCFCASMFHLKGLQKPKSINLEKRKLQGETNEYFLKFMGECESCLKDKGLPWPDYVPPTEWPKESDGISIVTIPIDKNAWYDKMMSSYKELDERYYKLHTFTKWIKKYGLFKFGIKEMFDRRSNNVTWVYFKERSELQK